MITNDDLCDLIGRTLREIVAKMQVEHSNSEMQRYQGLIDDLRLQAGISDPDICRAAVEAIRKRAGLPFVEYF